MSFGPSVTTLDDTTITAATLFPCSKSSAQNEITLEDIAAWINGQIVAGDIPDISATYLTAATAASTYLTQANAASTYLTQANAASTYQPLDADLTTWAGITPGTNVGTALAANVGSAGAFVVNGGALGTPSSGTLTNCSGLPISGIASLGTGVATALGNNTNSSGGPVTGGAITSSGLTMATARLLGRTTASTGAVEEITVGSGLSLSGGSLTATGGGGTVIPSVQDFRITTESGVPVSTSDRTSQSTIYLTPFKGRYIALYNGSSWEYLNSAEVSLALSSLTSGKNYDVFAYNSGGTLTLELSAAWSTDTARADAITTQDGVPVKSGATTRRWIGTIRTTGTTTTEDSESQGFIWNVNNQVLRRQMKYQGSGTEHSYSTFTWREWNGGTGGPHRIYWVAGEVQTIESSGWVEAKGDGTNVGITSFSLNDAAAEGMAVFTNQLNNYLRCGMGAFNQARLGFNEMIVTQIANGGSFNYYRLQAGVWR